MIREHKRKVGPLDVEGTLTKEEGVTVLDILLSTMIRKRAEAKKYGDTMLGRGMQAEVKVIGSALKKIQTFVDKV